MFTKKDTHLPFPPSVQDVLAARLSLLGPGDETFGQFSEIKVAGL